MKKYFLLIAATLFATTIFCGCSKDDDNLSNSDILGKWVYVKTVGYESDLDGSNKDDFYSDDYSYQRYVLFKNDGTGVESFSKDIDDSSTPDFSYKIDGRVLTFSNSRYEYYIKKLNKKEMIWSYNRVFGDYIENGQVYFERVK